MSPEPSHTPPAPEVVVVDPDPAWPAYFRALRDFITPALAGVPHVIEHVGSTSVPGLAAKPIIDLTVVVPDAKYIPDVIARLEGLGYRHRGDLGVTAREAFSPPPTPPAGVRWMRHNLYAAPRDAAVGIQNPLRFRDYLRTHPEAVAEYARLKRGLAERHPDSVDRYCRAKTMFIVDCLRRAGMPEDELAAVIRANLGDEV